MKQYVVTEEEFMSLIESLELHALQKNNIMREDLTKPPTHADIHIGFHDDPDWRLYRISSGLVVGRIFKAGRADIWTATDGEDWNLIYVGLKPAKAALEEHIAKQPQPCGIDVR